MLLYKFTTNFEIAKQVSNCIFRFYELTKYIKMEDLAGRADPFEGSINFQITETISEIKKLPVGSFNGVEFKFSSWQNSSDYLSQYFVFCLSKRIDASAITDSSYVVELDQDIFSTLEILLDAYTEKSKSPSQYKLYSHGSVFYYDIDRHPPYIGDEPWREVYLKHSRFEHQSEYRAALFMSNLTFETRQRSPIELSLPIYQNEVRLSFDMTAKIHFSKDAEGWRYVEIDMSEFANKMSPVPCAIKQIDLPH